MGQTLSEPITAKESASLQSSRVKVGSSSMQGWRISMEDAHTHILQLTEDKDAMFFGVYDGHGGGKIAAYVSKHLHKIILKQPEYQKGDIETAIAKGFLECDETMRTEESLKDEMSGSTAITALVRDNKVFINNVGDSRCIAGVSGKALALSVDHKPQDEKEHQRIVNAGGFVEFNRVNGNLALSRALGDFAFKTNTTLPAEEQVVSSCPDIVVREIGDDWDFILLACDGIWDVLTNQDVADFVIKRIGEGKEPEVICEELMTKCLAPDSTMGGLGCDNMTVILVCLLQDKPYQRLVDKCAKLAANLASERNQEEGDQLNGSGENGTDPKTTNGHAIDSPVSSTPSSFSSSATSPSSIQGNDEGEGAESQDKRSKLEPMAAKTTTSPTSSDTQATVEPGADG
ncbi:probable protein phosphatase 2C T23F11.1 [Tigriopus californicus]|nr:probable protein phosphatase 2C T23F11.1 [Tigriopus californicus]